eukprot:TRINITY_DN13914_c0_g1_i1.p1 TRINITY_DN13914_c0_g1~~TRINITY_DN13914_c0_g1_i1.p1  ORF type:complete len:478 (+),score=144.38 TRINITY_DN13914_c0_g1_i1:56-1435(+)
MAETGSAKRKRAPPAADEVIDLDGGDEPVKSKPRRKPPVPLAERMRPKRLMDLIGQPSLADGGAVGTLLRRGVLPSLLLWGPPGCGKTTFADLAAASVPSCVVRKLSAVTAGVKELREAIEVARGARRLTSTQTVLFVDEIHRFSKAQQDALLPAVEQGVVTLLGATTENPSFSVNGALLSRCRVVVFRALTAADVDAVLRRALAQDAELKSARVTDEALGFLSAASDGDARTALNSLELAVGSAPTAADGPVVTLQHAQDSAAKVHVLYDRKGDEHYNIISALHKSMRGSDPDAALYWLARMLEAGEDPRFVARRLIRFASEDVGLADSSSLAIAVAGLQAVQGVGMPECDVCLAQVVAHLSLAPKSVSVYSAYKGAKEAVKGRMNDPVPLHIRNAPHPLLKSLGWGSGYVYPPDAGGREKPQSYLPDGMAGVTFLSLTDADRRGLPGTASGAAAPSG